jgi:hypothetical protein
LGLGSWVLGLRQRRGCAPLLDGASGVSADRVLDVTKVIRERRIGKSN